AEHGHLNDELAHLGQVVTDLAALLEQPGPWNGLTPDSDVPLAAAEIEAMLIELRGPLTAAEEAMTDALNAAEDDTNPRNGRRWRDQRDLRNRGLSGLADSEGSGRPLPDRLAALDRLVADVQRYRAELEAQHHLDAEARTRTTRSGKDSHDA
ncbi:MAG TPA: hypothetical protein VFG15_18930, partial [Amycolatopsis sp.]|nr:hypothetical protein [Amycolatopsis sp.]